MDSFYYLQKLPIARSLGTFLILLFSSIIYGQCYTATYSITRDYTNTDISLSLKKKLAKNAQENKKIYQFIQSPTHSSEWVDSIANIVEVVYLR